MARRKTLKKLQQRLVARRAALMRSLREELADLSGPEHTTQPDFADAAFDSYTDEVSSQLAELESEELAQIEDALQRIKEGRYGRCEVCGCRIPAARLNALPFTSTCVCCRREQETAGERWADVPEAGWHKVYDSELSRSDREPDISSLGSGVGIDLSRNL